ncbi:hypothetical protein VPHK406_0098 [Vibrio phage K406]
MKTILEAIQQYPDQFIGTINARAETTPSETNRIAHLHMADMIMLGNWVTVKERLFDMDYRKPLDGVVACLTRYSDMEHETFCEIFELFEEGKIV